MSTKRHYIHVVLCGCVAALAVGGLSGPALANPDLGTVITNTTRSFGSLPTLVATFAYITGIFAAVWAILGFKDHVDSPNNTPLDVPVKRLLMGSLLLAAPFTIEAAINAVSAGLSPLTSTGFRNVPGAGGPPTLANIAAVVMDNTAGPLQVLFAGFSYIAGLIFIVIAATRLIKNMQDGPRGPAGIGTIMTLIVAGALLSIGNIISAFSASLFGSGNVRVTSAIGSFTPDPAGAQLVDITVEAILKFMIIVGIIAFIRGLFVLRAAADGAQQVSLMQAFTFLFGGTLAINLGPLINAIVATLRAAGFVISDPFG